MKKAMVLTRFFRVNLSFPETCANRPGRSTTCLTWQRARPL